MSTKVSIITVVFNSAETIERCIKSVLDQDYKEIEYLIIDGGSTDGTVDLIEKYHSRIDYFRSQKDNGIYDAMNIGINAAKGDIIALLNADDWYEEGAVSAVVDIFDKHGHVDIVHANIIEHKNDKSKMYRPNTSKARMFYQGMTYHHPTFFVRRKVYECLMYDTNYRIVSDYKFTMECLRDGFIFHHLDKGIVNLSYGGISSSFWVRIREGHQIRMDLGFNRLLVWYSTIFRFTVSLASALKNTLRAVTRK
jgi:glycosyltransferase involved in cell wall biosynthesis